MAGPLATGSAALSCQAFRFRLPMHLRSMYHYGAWQPHEARVSPSRYLIGAARHPHSRFQFIPNMQQLLVRAYAMYEHAKYSMQPLAVTGSKYMYTEAIKYLRCRVH